MIQIDELSRERMISHARRVYPDECCGFLYGQGDSRRQVVLAREVENSREGDRRRRFSISPADYMEAERFAAANDLELVGIYHSHPDHPAKPSETDRLSAQPWFSYIIMSVMNGEFTTLTSWRLDEGQQFQEEEVREYSITS